MYTYTFYPLLNWRHLPVSRGESLALNLSRTSQLPATYPEKSIVMTPNGCRGFRFTRPGYAQNVLIVRGRFRRRGPNLLR